MSNVFKGKQEKTGLEYFDNCYDILAEMRRVLFNTKYFPKRYLYTDVVPIMKLYHRMRNNIVFANTIYPYDEDELKRKKDYIQIAIESCEAIIVAFQDAIMTMETLKPSNVLALGEMLIEEAKLLRGLKKNVKVLKNRK